MSFATSFTCTGTVAATNNSTTLTGTGTKFLLELTVGSVVVVSGQTRTVSAISTDTSLTVTANFTPAFSGQTFTSDSTLVSGAETFDGLATFNGSNPTRGSASESQISVTHPLVFASAATLTKGTSKRNTIKLGDATKYCRITSRDFTNTNQGIIDFGTEGVMIFEARGFIGNGAPTIAALVRADYLTAVMNYSGGNSTYVDMFYRSLNTIAALDVPNELTIVLANTFKCSFGVLFKPSLGATIGAIKFVEGDNYDGTTDKLAFILNCDDGGTIPPITHPKINNSQTISYFRNAPDGTNQTGTITFDRQTIKYNLDVLLYTWCGGTHSLDNATLPSGFSADIKGHVSSLAAGTATQQVRYSFTAPLLLAAGDWKIRMWDDTETQINDASLASEHKIIWRKLVNAKDDTSRSLTQRTNPKIRMRKLGYLDVDLSYSYFNARVDYLVPQATSPLWTNTGTITAISTAQELSDEYDKVLAADLSIERGPTRSGNQFVIGSYTLNLDATAASLCAVVSGVSITAKSTGYIGGVVSTTGKTVVKNGALLNGGTFNGDVDYDTGANTTLTGVTCTGAMDFSVAGTYTLLNCTLATITNSSGGNVTIRAINSSITTNTGPNITIEYYSQVTHTIKDGATPKQGAIVGYWDGTGTDRTYSASFVAGALTSDVNGQVIGYVRYRVNNTTYTGITVYVGLPGYLRYVVPSTLTGASVTSDILLAADFGYNGTPSTGTIINYMLGTITQAGNATTQGIYDYYIQNWYTAANLPCPPVLAFTGASINTLADMTFILTSGTLSGLALSIDSGAEMNANGGTLACDVNVAGDLNLGGAAITGTVNSQGGTVDAGDVGTYSFDSTGTLIFRMTPTAPGDYILGGNHAGTVDLRNLSAHAITNYVPLGVTTTTANNTGGVITVLYPDFNVSIPNLVAAYIAWDDGADVQQSYDAVFTGTKTLTLPNTKTGETWHYHIRKKGYDPIKGFVTFDGLDKTIDGTLVQRTNFDGTPTYTGTTSSDCVVALHDPATDHARIDVQAAVQAQTVYDMIEDALVTSNGISTPLFAQFSKDAIGLQAIKLSSNMSLRRWHVGDSAAGVLGIVSQIDNAVVDQTNGPVSMVGTPIYITKQDVTDAAFDTPSISVIPADGSVGKNLDEVRAIKGLDATRPLTVTPTSMDAGTIHIDLTGDGVNTTTATRND